MVYQLKSIGYVFTPMRLAEAPGSPIPAGSGQPVHESAFSPSPAGNLDDGPTRAVAGNLR